MLWQSIVAGVDESPAGVLAARAAVEIASQTAAKCRLVHVTAELANVPLLLPETLQIDDLMERVTATAGETIRRALRGELPDDLADELEVRAGKAGSVLPLAAHDHHADLVVIGGKHHMPPTRWFGGSTAHHLLRVLDAPLLVASPSWAGINRVLVATDLSHAASALLDTAVAVAQAFNATLSLLHVIEPVPYLADHPSLIDHEAFAKWSIERFESLAKKHCSTCEYEIVVPEGDPVEVATAQATTGADLLIVGSHGKGWVDRVLVGSTTTGLLNRLPTSLLILPVGPPLQS